MNLSNQRKMAAQLLKIGRHKVCFEPDSLDEIKEAITKFDIRGLIAQGKIKASMEKSQSRHRARKLKLQKKKGRRSGSGSRKGKAGSRMSRKEAWMLKARNQRRFIKSLKLKNLIAQETYKKIYKMIKASFFRSIRHIKLYLTENNLFVGKK